MASATPDLRLPSQLKLVLIVPTHRGMASWPGWLVTYRDKRTNRSSILAVNAQAYLEINCNVLVLIHWALCQCVQRCTNAEDTVWYPYVCSI